MLLKQYSDFEKISEGDVIGIDGQEKIKTEKNSVILFATNTNKIGDEAFLLGEEIKDPAQ